jgi:hypothetical protein
MHDDPFDEISCEMFESCAKNWVLRSVEKPFKFFGDLQGLKLRRVEPDGINSDDGPAREYSTDALEASVKKAIADWSQSRTR